MKIIVLKRFLFLGVVRKEIRFYKHTYLFEYMARKLLLSQEFGSNIFTRRTISAFFEKVNSQKEKEIVFDFKDIEFISRSCVDEYLKQKEKSNKKIVEENMSQEVCSKSI